MVMTVALDGCRADGYRGLVTVAMMTVPLWLMILFIDRRPPARNTKAWWWRPHENFITAQRDGDDNKVGVKSFLKKKLCSPLH